MDNDNFKEIVKEGYENNNYYEEYRKNRKLNGFEKGFLDQFISFMPSNPTIIDWGSGPGVPYDLYLSNLGARIFGIDFSEKHINIARNNVPNAEYCIGDFSNFNYGEKKYDGIISLYAIIHIPRDDHEQLFKTAYNILKKKGIILFTIGFNDKHKIKDDFCNYKMAWSHYQHDISIKLLDKVGFKIISSKNENDYGSNEKHLWVLGRK